MNNGREQLIRNVFHCVILKSFVICVSVLVFSPLCTQLNAGDQQWSGGLVVLVEGCGAEALLPAPLE